MTFPALESTRDAAWDAYQRNKGQPASVRRPLRMAHDAAEVAVQRAERLAGNVGAVALESRRALLRRSAKRA